jgi:hypothetical protein
VDEVDTLVCADSYSRDGLANGSATCQRTEVVIPSDGYCLIIEEIDMIKNCLNITFLLLLGLPLFDISVIADSCRDPSYKKVLQSTEASAGSWANLRNNPGSLRFESARLLKEGDAILTTNTVEKNSALILESSPKKFLSDYDEFNYCQEKLKTSAQSPIKFAPPAFTTMEDLSNWFSDFSQGSGKEGKELYAICDKSCSPQYSLKIEKKDGKLIVAASAICGHARDKDDDMYKLCTAIN